MVKSWEFDQLVRAAWIGLVVAVSPLFGGALAGCSSEEPSATPSVDATELARVSLKLDVPEGHNVSSVQYEVFAGLDVDAAPPSVESAQVEVSSAKATAIALVYLSPGTYTALLQASTDGPDVVLCRGQATFEVAAGVTTTVDVSLLCIDPMAPATGGANLTSTFAFEHPTCGLTEVFVGPLTTFASGGEPITLHSEATPGTLFAWSVWPSSMGVIAPLNAPDATFDCTQVGSATLSITVANPAQACVETKSIAVKCEGFDECGDGFLGPTEACEPPTPDCSPVICQFFCGNGVVGNGEQCDDGNRTSGDGCTATCITEFCGDGIVNDGESCDSTPGCTPSCVFDEPVTCSECIANNCAALVSECDAPSNSDAMNGNRCRNLLDCYASTECALGADSVVCVCGTFSEIDCAGGEADGQCLSVARRSAGTGDANLASVLNTLLRFNAPDYPIGDANLLHYCAVSNCADCEP